MSRTARVFAPMTRATLLLSGLLFSGWAAAQFAPAPIPPIPEPITPVAPQDAPPPPQQEQIEPEVTIVERPNYTAEEYRINGRLFKVKITPASGPSYYLIDMDGDGALETRRHEADNLQVPHWILFRW
jgi:hypothetical protein